MNIVGNSPLKKNKDSINNSNKKSELQNPNHLFLKIYVYLYTPHPSLDSTWIYYILGLGVF